MSLMSRLRGKEPTPPPEYTPPPPSAAKPVFAENPRLSEHEKEALRQTIKHCIERTAEIDAYLKSVALAQTDLDAAPTISDRDTVKAQTMRRERVELAYDRDRAERQLRGPTPDEMRRETQARERELALLDVAVRDRVEIVMRNVAKYEAAGEWQQARIWRNELPNVRATVAREMNIKL